MEKDFKRILVTAALPYANGPLHLGHLAGAYLPADIYVKYQRMKKRDIVFVCGTDEHGVPITLTAEKEKIPPQEVVDKYHQQMKKAFTDWGVEFDNFSQTSRKVHHETTQEFFREIYQNNPAAFKKKSVRQQYCETDKMFLADRYVVGECPNCHHPDASGDQCERCGTWLDPLTLIHPRCKNCGNQPVVKETYHLFFTLGLFQKKLQDYIRERSSRPGNRWKENVIHYCEGWFAQGLDDRAITRDLKWGIPLPPDIAAREGLEGKIFYVWFDAPIGYISATKEWAFQQGKPELWKKYWQSPDTRLIHFIGKDNIVFHALFFPAMLMANGHYVLADNVPANEFLNLEGQKLSTSRNWAVWLHQYLEKFPPDPLRYVLTSIAPETKDSDFSWKDFQVRNNSELADILGNFINRSLTFIDKNFGGKVPAPHSFSAPDQKMLQHLTEAPGRVGGSLEKFEIREAAKGLMDIARAANKYFNDREPWKSLAANPQHGESVLLRKHGETVLLRKHGESVLLRKHGETVLLRKQCATTLYVCVQTIRTLAIVMFPFLPFSSEKLWKILNLKGTAKEQNWDSAGESGIPAGHPINHPEILFNKFEDNVIEDQISKLHASQSGSPSPVADEGVGLISIDDFRKMDLRVAEIVEAEAVPKADRLLKLQVKVGNEQRQIIAGIAQHYQPQDLKGKRVVVVFNLTPAKIRGFESQGMLLAASTEDGKLTLVTTDSEINTGAKVK